MINKNTIVQTFNQLAKTYDVNAVLSQEVGTRLFEQLQFMRLNPNKILNLGAATGFFEKALTTQYPKAKVFNIDIAEQMCHQMNAELIICADAELLALKTNSIDLIFANLLLPWCPDIPQVLEEIKRVLKPNGLLLFTTLGPDTLKEIGKYDFNDMHDIGDLLLQLKFVDPVMNMEHLTFTYTNTNNLIQDLENWGLAANQGLPFVLTQNLMINGTPPNPFPITFEIIYGHAWIGDKNIGIQNAAGEVVIPISAIKRKLSN